MKKVWLFVLFVVLLVGCSSNEETLSVEKTGKLWSISIDYSLTKNKASHKAILTFLGDDVPDKFRVYADFPGDPNFQKEMKMEDPNQKTFVISEKTIDRPAELEIDFIKKKIETSYIQVFWNENGKELSEEIQL